MLRIYFVTVFYISLITAGDRSEFKIEVQFKPDDCQKLSKQKDFIKVHYTGTVLNGRQFDSSWDRNEPFGFELGSGQVIKGWDEGLLNMCIGEKRKLIIPPELGYGNQEMGSLIPAGSTLIFETELMDINDPPQHDNMFEQIDANGDKYLSKAEVYRFLSLSTFNQAQDEKNPHKIVDDIFMMEDSNRDGLLSFEEFDSPKHEEL